MPSADTELPDYMKRGCARGFETYEERLKEFEEFETGNDAGEGKEEKELDGVKDQKGGANQKKGRGCCFY